jgi:hypothetical protein
VIKKLDPHLVSAQQRYLYKHYLYCHELVDLCVIHAAVTSLNSLAEQKTEDLCAETARTLLVPSKEILIHLGIR